MKKNNLLVEVDEVKITIIMDNTFDAFMAGNEVVHRFDFSKVPFVAKDGLSTLIAEHGFSAMIQVKCGNKEEAVLYDTGTSPRGTLHNMNSMGINVNDMQAIILSHGHIDHTMGLPALLDELAEKQQMPLIFHPDALLERKIVMPNGDESNGSAPKLNLSQQAKLIFCPNAEPTLLVEDMILISGQIGRVTDFETGFPIHYTKRNGQWENDPLVLDDQCAIINVRGQGLVIITGCCHAGVINSIRYAQAITGCQQVYAVLGGFHLTGQMFEKNIPQTIAELQKINPIHLMPGHCTGWSAIHKIAQSMPNAFIPTNVGTTLVFQAK
ncbi:MBL fold metallo-hydrolase [Anaerospora hongkongensis]|uniref:MBL fold metallo-hydrolase n=1 Tax=Anaerospora hongkongensis TaxID=244830 RepID=UPI00289A64F8|nr:MBL fold metallo-hydrolase [Anaerospora hongkongensis]